MLPLVNARSSTHAAAMHAAANSHGEGTDVACAGVPGSRSAIASADRYRSASEDTGACRIPATSAPSAPSTAPMRQLSSSAAMIGDRIGVSRIVHGANCPKNASVSGAVMAVAQNDARTGAATNRSNQPFPRGGPASDSPNTAA